METVKIPNDLVEGIARLFEKYLELKPATTTEQLLLALEYMHACIERYDDETPPEKLN
jgi:hypothetical protein